MADATPTPQRHLHLVTDDEAADHSLRQDALVLFEQRYQRKPESLRAMMGALRAAARAVGAHYDERNFEWDLLIDPVLLSEVMSRVNARYSPRTEKKIHAAIKRMLWYHRRVGLISDDEYRDTLDDFPKVTGEGLAGTHLSVADVAALLGACRADPNWATGTRDEAMLLMLAGTGMRRTELVSATFEELDLDARRLQLIVTKGGRPRTAFLSATLVPALNSWITGWRRHKAGPIFVPLTRSGRVAGERPLSAHQLWKVVRRRGLQAGLASVTPHDFRRYCVGQLLDHGVDLSTAAKVVGHRSVRTTQGYDRRPEERIRDATDLIELPALVPRQRPDDPEQGWTQSGT